MAQHDQHSGYADHVGRSVKALSEEEIRSLLDGEGVGYALAAELNHYPGPKHALDLRAELGLTREQIDTIDRVRDAMLHEARRLGREVVQAEARLDSLFAHGTIDEGTLRVSVAEVARLEGTLRATHLIAHIEVRRILTDDQVDAYDRLRGYE